MATRTWTGASDNNWANSANWFEGAVPTSFDAVILDHSKNAAAYQVDIDATAAAASVSIGVNGGSIPITLLMNSSSASLTVGGAISFLDPAAMIEGQGAINAGGGFNLWGSGSATILAGTATTGGTLDLTGSINFNIVLGFANTNLASTLKLESTSLINSAIAISSATQTLEIGATANLTITTTENVANGAIKLDGGALSVSSGLTLGAGASISGTGTVSADIRGSGTVTASNGALTLTGPIGSAGGTTSLVIGDGSSLYLTSTYGIGSTSVAPTLTFQGTGDLFQAINAGMYNIYLGTISGFAGTDLMKIASFGSGDTLSFDSSAHTVTIYTADGYQSKVFTFDSAATASEVFNSSVTPGGNHVAQTTINGVVVDVLSICFMAGTMIRTPQGEVAVETLQRGDLVVTIEGAAKPVSWLGKQTVSSRFADPVRSWPVRIVAGALGENVPARDLLVSPDHALLVEGVLVHAGALVNDTSIVRETSVPASFIYYHVELDDHSLILAENVPAETFIDNADRLHFDNWAEHEVLYPAGKPIEELPFPRATARRQVPVALRHKLDERAQVIGAGESAVA